MKIPFTYNIRSIRSRWRSTIVAVFAIAGVVAVFIAVLAMARGFEQTLVTSGSNHNAIILRGGATSEMESALDLDQVKVISDSPFIKRDESGKPLLSAEVVVVAAFTMRSTGTEANVLVRGVSENALAIRDSIKIREGRLFNAGLNELVVGQNAVKAYQGLDLGRTIKFGGSDWMIVGILDAGGSAFDSEVWCDTNNLNQTYKRPSNIFQSVTVRMNSPESFIELKDSLSIDPRLTITIEREDEYFAKQSEMVSTLIRVLGFLVASVMAIGAIFGAINTMYSALSARYVEIATLRAIGFKSSHIISSFVAESVFISFIGGVVGAILILPINGNVASTMNWQSFSQISFEFLISPSLIAEGIFFALILGFFGGLFPAYRASRVRIAVALRGM